MLKNMLGTMVTTNRSKLWRKKCSEHLVETMVETFVRKNYVKKTPKYVIIEYNKG